MSRLDELRRFVDKDSLGIEVAPYFTPIAPKADGYKVLVVDVCDTETLRQNAGNDPNISNRKIQQIEDVDIVSDASKLLGVITSKGLSGQIGYIVSSHNFEHLPDPISFLKGCSAALTPGGVLSMAIPDCRASFDHFRMPTRLSDWLAAYHRGHNQPSPETLFDSDSNHAPFMRGGLPANGLDIACDDPDGFAPVQRLRSAYAGYIAGLSEPGDYRDAHCNIVFGASFELMIRDLNHLGLVDLEVFDISPTVGLEFIVHLRKPGAGDTAQQSDEAFYSRRHELMKEVNSLLGTGGLALSASRLSADHAPFGEPSAKRIARSVLGNGLFQKLKKLNAQRRVRRKRKGR